MGLGEENEIRRFRLSLYEGIDVRGTEIEQACRACLEEQKMHYVWESTRRRKHGEWRGRGGASLFSDAKRGSMVSCTWTKGLLGEVADPKEDVHKCPD